jgi:hypothetical protein
MLGKAFVERARGEVQTARPRFGAAENSREHRAPAFSGSLGVLGLGPFGKRRSLLAGLRKSAVQFVSPVVDVAGRCVTVEHPEGFGADVGELVILIRGNVYGLSSPNLFPFVPQADLAGSLQHHVDFFLRVVVPGHLPALGIECGNPHAKVIGLDRRGPADEIFGHPTGRIATSVHVLESYSLHQSVAKAGLGK